MPLVHAYNQTVADGTATSVVRPSDWNSAHNQIVYLSNNTTGLSSVSGTNIAIAGGTNITASGVQGAGGATIIFSGPQFNNANGITFGSNLGTVTASYSQAVGTNTQFAGTNISGSMAVNSNGVSISLSAPAPGGGGGATLVEYEPVPLYSSAGLSLAQNTLYINTLVVPQNVAAKYMVMGVVMTGGWGTSTPVTNSTATTGSSFSGSAGQTLNFNWYTDGGGGMETNIYTLGTAQMTMSTQISWSQTNSNTTTGTNSIGSTMGFTYGIPLITSGTLTSQNALSSVITWGTTTASFTGSSTFSTNGTSTSGWPGGTSNATWAGSRILFVPLNTTFTAGKYWLGVQRSSATLGGASSIAGTYSFMIQSFTSYDSSSRFAPFGYATSQLSFMSHPAGMANGMLTASYNSTSNYAGAFGSQGAIAKNIIFGSSASITSGTLSRFYNRFIAEII